MSRLEYRDGGSAFGPMQRVASNGQFTRVQRAYRSYINHGRGCATCAVDSERFTTAEALWEACRAANS
ncbi:hypothetical protein [Streptomyces sp. NPDC050564]|uniref:hypothetical protein n=1 Tax=Streptomyces sp. NPDC050564 TaxID=3365631 RepID=UPI0037875F60